MTCGFRIAIATAGRFHVLDLAREPNALGYTVDFYSYVPQSRALTQALAGGLPVICTDRAGGADLGHTTAALAQYITVIPHDDLSALVAAVVGLRDRHKAGAS
jgi:hypothetical protein